MSMSGRGGAAAAAQGPGACRGDALFAGQVCSRPLTWRDATALAGIERLARTPWAGQSKAAARLIAAFESALGGGRP